MRYLVSYPPIADGKNKNWSSEHFFSCSKVNFSSLLLREASRITPTSRGFDGSLFRVLRTWENKNIGFLVAKQTPLSLRDYVKKTLATFSRSVLQCSVKFSDLAIVIVYNQLNRVHFR